MPRVDQENQARYWLDRRIDGLSCLHADFRTHDYAPHIHDEFVVAMTEVGGSEFKSRGETQEAKTSLLAVFNPHEAHSGSMAHSPRWRYRGLYFAAPAVRRVTSAIGMEIDPHFTRNLFCDTDLITSFLRLHHALDEGAETTRLEELLVASFGELVRRYSTERAEKDPSGPDLHAVSSAIDLIHDRHSDELKLDEIARAAGMTTFQIIRLFKQATGLTPHAYLTQVRLKATIRSLKGGESTADAALAAGFYDQAAFNKHFKRTFGITPMQWLNAIRT